MNKILHLTHTDIPTDSRILKEMDSISSESREVYGIGVELAEGSTSTNLKHSFEYRSVKLHSRKLTKLPKVLRHALSLIELTSKMLVKSLRVRPDVVHCHDTLVLPIGALIKWFGGAKLIYDAHELESQKNGSTPVLSKLTLWVEARLWSSIDELIVVSPSIDNWYQENLGPKSSKVIYNSPYLPPVVESKSDYFREKFGIDADTKIFLYIGILGTGRGIELLCDAFKSDEINSAVVFLGYGELTAHLETFANRYNNIYLHPAVAHEDVVPVARSADYGMCLIENVSLSDYYCLPNKFFEYTLAGIPVIASDFPDLRKVINEFGLGFYCDRNVDSIRDLVLKIEQETAQIEIDVKDIYPLTWEAQSEKLNKMYNKLLSEGKK